MIFPSVWILLDFSVSLIRLVCASWLFSHHLIVMASLSLHKWPTHPHWSEFNSLKLTLIAHPYLVHSSLGPYFLLSRLFEFIYLFISFLGLPGHRETPQSDSIRMNLISPSSLSPHILSRNFSRFSNLITHAGFPFDFWFRGNRFWFKTIRRHMHKWNISICISH